MHSIDSSDFLIGEMNCDRIARCYRWLEYLSFGRALERRRREYLIEVESARSVLILGRWRRAVYRGVPWPQQTRHYRFGRTQPAYVSAGEAAGGATNGWRGPDTFLAGGCKDDGAIARIRSDCEPFFSGLLYAGRSGCAGYANCRGGAAGCALDSIGIPCAGSRHSENRRRRFNPNHVLVLSGRYRPQN